MLATARRFVSMLPSAFRRTVCRAFGLTGFTIFRQPAIMFRILYAATVAAT